MKGVCMDDHKKFIAQCTIREVVKYVVIFIVAILVVMYGIPRQVADVETQIQRANLVLENHTERIAALEHLVREQSYTNREIQRDLDKIGNDIGLLISIIKEFNEEIRILGR